MKPKTFRAIFINFQSRRGKGIRLFHQAQGYHNCLKNFWDRTVIKALGKVYKQIMKSCVIMKVPKTFVSENCSEKFLEKMLNFEKDRFFNRHIDRLVSSCDQFLDLAFGSSDVKYGIGEKIANKYMYTLKDVENLSVRVFLDSPWKAYDAENLGFYLSAMINKIITEDDTIGLTFGIRLAGIGSYLAKGKVVASSNAGSWVGANMTGGRLTILGNAEDYVAYEMKNGIISVTGKVGGTVGYQAQGGEIYVNHIEGMIARSCLATIYRDGEKIWYPDPTKIATGKGVID